MLYFFTDPYQDEAMFSILDRYNRYSGNMSSRRTQEELFGQRTTNQSSNFPSYLSYFSKQFTNDSIYSPEYFINNHTIFPIYRPFLSNQRANQLVTDMEEDRAASIHMRIGEMAGGICKDYGLRVCLKCMIEDKKNYGESYIHRIHQVPGNQICNKHSEVLRKIILPKYLGKFQLVNFISCKIETENKVVNDKNYRYFKHLSIDISRLFEETSNNLNIEVVVKKYKVMLMKKGYASISGIVNWSKVENDLLDTYPSDFLNKLESNIIEEKRYKWIKEIMNIKKLVHPIRHLVFIRFIFGSVDKFLLFNELEYRPFGEGPWPCLNPVASHYKKEVITDIELSKRSTAIAPLGIFKCSCGYAYTRLGPDKNVNDRYKKRMVKSYGDIWMKALKKNLEKQIFNISDLKRIMECDSKTIGKYAKELDVFHLLNSKMKTEPIRQNNMPKYNKELEDIYKLDIKIFIEDNPNANRNEIKQNLSKQCAWMMRYRKDWFNSVMPKPIDNKIDRRKKISYADWEQRDIELSEKLCSIINEIEADKNGINITLGFLCGQVEFPIYKHLDKLPKTKLILNQNKIINT